MFKIPVKKLVECAKLPTRGTVHSAGYDLYSNTSGVIEPRCRCLVSTGISIQIPDGHCGLIWPRSGLSVKYGIETGAGVIDSDYTGDIGVILHNFSDEPFTFEKHMRIAQIVITPIITPPLIETHELKESKRGINGYGSTGLF